MPATVLQAIHDPDGALSQEVLGEELTLPPYELPKPPLKEHKAEHKQSARTTSFSSCPPAGVWRAAMQKLHMMAPDSKEIATLCSYNLFGFKKMFMWLYPRHPFSKRLFALAGGTICC